MAEIVINNFQQGQASSPYATDGAYAKAVNLDVWGQPGIARINYLPINDTSSNNVFSSFARVTTTSSEVYAAAGSGLYYSADKGTSWTAMGGTGNRIAIWKDYLFATLGTDIDVYGPLSSSASFTVNWKTDLQDNLDHFLFPSKNDGKLYITNGRYIASVSENAGQNFVPGTSASYTYTKQHLTIPEEYQSRCLEEQRENLLIGTRGGTISNALANAPIFIWDRGRNEYDYPVTISGGSISSMKTIGNRTYVVGGENPNIYLFSEAGLQQIARFPYDYDNGKELAIGAYGKSSIAAWRDKIYLGIGSSDGQYPVGLYALKGNALNLEHGLSTGENGENGVLSIGAVYAFDNDTLLYGFFDQKTDAGGVEKITNANNRYTGYSAYFESLLYRVGTKADPASFSQIEVQLGRPLQTGEGVRLKYRTDINSSWKTIGTLTHAGMGAVQSFLFPFGINGVENLQIKCELTTGASSKNTPYLYEIRLR